MSTTLPPSSDFTGAAVTEGGFKSAITALRDFLSGLLGTDGATTTALAALGAPLSGYTAKTGAYSIAAGDRGKLIDCSGTWTASLLAAATAGSGFVVGISNSGSGVITIDANLSETIDGATTLALPAGDSLLLACTGTSWVGIGKSAGASVAAASQAEMEAGTETDLRLMSPLRVAEAIAALGGGVDADVGAGGVGMIGMMVIASGSVASGATVAGSSLRDMVAATGTGAVTYGASARTGTWRNISGVTLTAGGTDAGMFQRIS